MAALEKLKMFKENVGKLVTLLQRDSIMNIFWVMFQLLLRKAISQNSLTTCLGIYLFGEPNTYCFDRALETEVFNEVVLERSCSEKLNKFHGKKALMMFCLSSVATEKKQ